MTANDGISDGVERPVRVRQLEFAGKRTPATHILFDGKPDLTAPPLAKSVPTPDPDEVPTEPLTRAEQIDAAVKSGSPRNLITLVLELQDRIEQLEGGAE